MCEGALLTPASGYTALQQILVSETVFFVIATVPPLCWQVVEVGKKFFSQSMATAFDDPRVTLLIDDAARYLREEGAGQNYDVIICDSSDPVGPADVLFQPEFFQSMKNALNPTTGVICTQGECQWLHLDFIAGVIGKVRNLFPAVKYAYTTIPTYPSGQIGFLIASVDANNDPAGEYAVVQ